MTAPYTTQQIEEAKTYLNTHDVPGFDRTFCDATDDDAVQYLDAAGPITPEQMEEIEGLVNAMNEAKASWDRAVQKALDAIRTADENYGQQLDTIATNAMNSKTLPAHEIEAIRKLVGERWADLRTMQKTNRHTQGQ